jgi:hypothetical protein
MAEIDSNGGKLVTYEKGKSGNAGRKGYQKFDTVVRKVLATAIYIPNPEQSDRPVKQREKVQVTFQEAAVLAVAAKAMKGDVQALAFLMSYTEGKPVQRTEVSGNVSHNMRFLPIDQLRKRMKELDAEIAEYDEDSPKE